MHLYIKPENQENILEIEKVVIAAFGGSAEAKLIKTIGKSSNFIPELSLVAVEKEKILGHILFSPIVIENETKSTISKISALALAPLAVIPARQKQVIGSELVRLGLTKCRDLNYNIVVVIGHPEYYPRFGFQTAKKFGIAAPFPVPDEAFMLLELQPDVLMGISGIVKYPAYFNEV